MYHSCLDATYAHVSATLASFDFALLVACFNISHMPTHSFPVKHLAMHLLLLSCSSYAISSMLKASIC